MDKKIIEKCYKDYQNKVEKFNKINNYYKGKTDVESLHKHIEYRSNQKVNCNFIQAFVDEEAEYSFINGITYTSKTGDNAVINDIEYNLSTLSEDYDISLGIDYIKYGAVYEICYFTGEGVNREFKCRKVDARHGYPYFNSEGELEYFLYIYTPKFSDEVKIDVYDNKYVYHLNASLDEIAPAQEHYFGFVPVGVALMDSELEATGTIYSKIKDLQDSYNINLSDSVCEISDSRSAIGKSWGVEAKDEEGKPRPLIDRNTMLIQFEGDMSTQDFQWVTKNINDTHIKNTLQRVRDDIHSLTNHIDKAEKMQSNTSGTAIRNRLVGLEQTCKRNEKAIANIIRNRLKCLFRFLFIANNKVYDYKTINIQFTPCIPNDITNIADSLSKIPHEVMSNKSKTALIPSITNVDAERKQIQLELDEADRRELDKANNEKSLYEMPNEEELPEENIGADEVE